MKAQCTTQKSNLGRLQVQLRGVVLLLALVVMVTGCGGNKVPDEVTLSLDGKEFKEPLAEIHEGQLMVPGSFIKDVLGKEVEWSEDLSAKAPSISEPIVHYSGKVGVLMYHDLMENPDRGDILSVDQFRGQMELLREEGFVPISIDLYLDYIGKGSEVPDNAVLITFDDGYESFYKYAFPILKEYNYPAVNFVIVSAVDSPSGEGRPKLTWEQMREMQEHRIGFYSHTYDMHRYGSIDAKGTQKPVTTRNLYLADEKRIETDEEYEKRMVDDLIHAEQRLKEELGNNRSVMALPYGAFNDKLLEILDSVGIEASFTVKEGINEREDRNGYRINAGRSDQRPEIVLAKLKGQDPSQRLLVNGDGAQLRISGTTVQFSKLLQGVSPEDSLVPLREVCQIYDIKVDWNHNKKLAVMTTAKISRTAN
ncbi:polysaccharide deacetylase family protein [Paenibacillus campinasensis]|uniref:NodB homology domain-containing protein n=1 Tax=Paenibacillus campinasensis TaxID=66347 RepID=A0A268EZS1_9BACL|nr:polysaccharide deacetylase family protein [Paenibacillus campinasensis]PAD78619.1 hypothetical protein CHH67_06095 [Paenibacillus campinasensis]